MQDDDMLNNCNKTNTNPTPIMIKQDFFYNFATRKLILTQRRRTHTYSYAAL